MRFGFGKIFGFVGAAVFWAAMGNNSGAADFAAPSSLPVRADFPDPLVMQNGQRVSSPKQWFEERRPELKALFEHYMYGQIPPRPPHMRFSTAGNYKDFLGGQATLRLITIETGSEARAPKIDLMLIVPNNRKRPAPVFLAMDFCGNQALTEDSRIPLPRSWMAGTCPGCSNNIATDSSRGAQSTNWPLKEIINRGYALATFYSGDVDSDRPDASTGLYAWLAALNKQVASPTNRGTLAAWAWGFHRCVDYLVNDGDVDAHRIAVLGHSRNGKTALLAGAMDERIAVVFPHQAGCGGTAPSRSKVGESIQIINQHFPHWFNGEFKKFKSEPERLPFDQNCLLALCAPRPVLCSAAEGDQWSNPAGQLEIVKAASSVYEFLGVKGFSPENVVDARKSGKASATNHFDSEHCLSYFIRDGRHSMIPEDWSEFLDFADRHFAKSGTPAAISK